LSKTGPQESSSRGGLRYEGAGKAGAALAYGDAFSTNNFNSLDIRAWYCRFEDRDYRLCNGAGAAWNSAPDSSGAKRRGGSEG